MAEKLLPFLFYFFRAQKHVRLISFLGLVCAALLFFSTCLSSNSGPSGPVSKEGGEAPRKLGSHYSYHTGGLKLS